ncbi:DUF692 family protein [Achromobacter spanius]|nr:DUF692 family protein [Achromobacter spanius]
MKIGINWTSTRDLASVREIINKGAIDFVEIMIDNFLSCNAASIKSVLGGTACAFHIMNSRFLHQDSEVLMEIACKINELSSALNPIYTSDHLGKFLHRGHYFPQMLEVNYATDLAFCSEKLSHWQAILGSTLFIENYPSIIAQPYKQADFFEQLKRSTSCNLLFDISNATIAEINIGEDALAWRILSTDTKHFHIAGFAKTSFLPHFFVDTHDCNIDPRSIRLAEKILNNREEITVCVERDSNFEVENWMNEISRVRNLIP